MEPRPIAPASPPPRRALRDLLTTVVPLALLLGLVGATAGSAIIPATARLAAPIVCPAGTESSGVTVRTRSSGGKTTSTWAVWCVDGRGFGRQPSVPQLLGTLFALETLAAALLLLPLIAAWQRSARS